MGCTVQELIRYHIIRYLRRLKDNIGDKDPEKVRAFVHKAKKGWAALVRCVESGIVLKRLLQSSHGYLSEVKPIETSLLQMSPDTAIWCWTMSNHDESRAGWVMMSVVFCVCASSSFRVYALTPVTRLELWSGQLRIVRVLAASHAIAMTGVQSRVLDMRCFTWSKCLQSATYCLSPCQSERSGLIRSS